MDEESLISKNVELTKYSNFGNKFWGDLIVIKDLSKLQFCIKYLYEHNNIKYQILGKGCNTLFYKFKGPYLKLDFSYTSGLIIPASESLSKIVARGVKDKLGGVQIFTGIPGSLGGAIAMNAGIAEGETKDITEKVWFITKNGDLKSHIVSKNSFSYRKNNFLAEGDIIYQAKLKITNMDIKHEVKRLGLKRFHQLKINTLGSTFKNGDSFKAGDLIDRSGLKGKSVGGVRVSYNHANFLENYNNGSGEDAVRLIDLIREKVYQDHRIELDLEIKIC